MPSFLIIKHPRMIINGEVLGHDIFHRVLFKNCPDYKAAPAKAYIPSFRQGLPKSSGQGRLQTLRPCNLDIGNPCRYDVVADVSL
jgi:hypothetical protein